MLSDRSPSLARTLSLACLLAAESLTLAGCKLPSRMPLDAAAGLYEKASLSYRVDAGQLSLPLAVSRIEGQSVSYDEISSGATPDRSTGTLTITYPHPVGRPGMAEVQMEIACQGDKPGKPKVREVWALDVPKADLDGMFEKLRVANFFQAEPCPAHGIVITTKLNGKTVQKSWQAVPELDALMKQARRHGQLAAYERVASPHDGNPLLTSVAAYKQMVARDGGGDAAIARSPGGAATR